MLTTILPHDFDNNLSKTIIKDVLINSENKIEMNFVDGHSYKGDIVNNEMTGSGQFTWKSNIKYEGEFYDNDATGTGTISWPNGNVYSGNVYCGDRVGFGDFHNSSKNLSYSGYWNNNMKHGKGKLIYNIEGSSFYDGEWLNDLKNGWGKRQYKSGNIYEGYWKNNLQHGDGTMFWNDCNHKYSGEWMNGVPHGHGKSYWMVQNCQKNNPVYNFYDGSFCNGIREGYGIFYYANGARFEGFWKDNMKHGHGKLFFKNGRMFEGEFEEDQIIDYPKFTPVRCSTPDMSILRTSSPCSNEQTMYSNVDFCDKDIFLRYNSLNTDNCYKDNWEIISTQMKHILTRYLNQLNSIYHFYFKLNIGMDDLNINNMINLQFWRFLKDCKFHHMLGSIARIMNDVFSSNDETDNMYPFKEIVFGDFLNRIILISIYLKSIDLENKEFPLIAYLVSLIEEYILGHATNLEGFLFSDLEKSHHLVKYTESVHEIYRQHSNQLQRNNLTITMRQFLFFLKDIGVLNDVLKSTNIVQILNIDDPNVEFEGDINLENQMTFLEYFEALIGCAEHIANEVGDDRIPNKKQCEDDIAETLDTIIKEEIINVSPINTEIHQDPNTLDQEHESSNVVEKSKINTSKESNSSEKVNMEYSAKWQDVVHSFFEEVFIPAAQEYLSDQMNDA